MNLSERSQRTIEQIINRANGEGRCPSLRLISQMLSEVNIEHEHRSTSQVRGVGNIGGRACIRHVRSEGQILRVRHRLRNIRVDSSDVPMSMVSEDMCDDLVVILMAENII